jgi:flagellar biosynthesis protein FlhG
MNDQALNLRKKVESIGRTKQAKVISVVSGKGGVGKSNISLNLSLSLINFNKKVLLIDLDIGMANIDILLGKRAKHHVSDMVDQQLSIWEIIETTEHGLSFIAGGNGLSELFELTQEKFDFFISQIEHVVEFYDFVIFDIGAGASKENLKFILTSHEILVVTTTEPTSITDAYAMIKHINQYKKDLSIFLVVNRCENRKEGKETADRLVSVTSRFLGKTIFIKGYIPDDNSVRQAVKQETPFLIFAPKCKASIAVQNLAVTCIKEGLSIKEKSHSVTQALRQFFTLNKHK